MLERLPLDSPAWGGFVAQMQDATPFHHPAWATMIARCYRFDAFALALRDASGAGQGYVAGFPVIELRSPLSRRRRWSCLPFTDECSPLALPGEARRLADAVEALRVDEAVASVGVGGQLDGVPALKSASRIAHVLALDPDPAVVERGFRSSVRRNVRAARDSGLKVRRATAETDMVDSFYRLQVMTRHRLGLPPQPRSFFRGLWREVLSPGLGHLTIVESGGRPVAGGVFLRWNGTTIYKYGASDPCAWNMRPNNLLFAEEIRDACLADCTTFHFGRTDVADEGLRRFKAGWGAVELPLYSTSFGAAPPEELTGPTVMRAVLRRSPEFVARAIGNAIYRYAA
jgi:CelD/BcsL family acetyltransferase involved in cellulose biosynthesis